MDPDRPPPQEGVLSREELVRYSRHLALPEVGVEGQEKLKAARVLLVGAGGLGSPVGLYLAAAGVGHIGLVDFDTVDVTNLQRQILYGTDDLGRPKLEVACERLRSVNPHIILTPHDGPLEAANALDLLGPYDIVIDGTDNFPTRYLVNDACGLLGKPNVYGSIYRFEGQVSVFHVGRGPCYRCLFPDPPPPGQVPSCAEGGVLGVLPGTIGTLQATEAVKLILDRGHPLIGRLLYYEALEGRFHEFKVPKDPRCPLCGETPTLTSLVPADRVCGRPGEESGVLPEDVITPGDLAKRLQSKPPPVLLDVRNPWEWSIDRLEGATLLPLPELERSLGNLDPAAETVLYCKIGLRSLLALRRLQKAGFRNVRHLRGGLHAWASDVDPDMLVY